MHRIVKIIALISVGSSLSLLSCSSWTSDKQLSQRRPAAVYDFLCSQPPQPRDFPNEVLPPGTILLDHRSNDYDPLHKSSGENHKLLRKRGSLGNTILVLNGDRAEGRIRRQANFVHAFLPGVRVAVLNSFPARSLLDVVDTYIPPDAELTDDEFADYKGLLRLRDCVEAVTHRKHPSRYEEMLGRAEELLNQNPGVVGFRHTDGASAVHRKRESLNLLLADFVPLTEPFEKWDKGAMSLGRAAEVRKARVAVRHRTWLYQRHLEACRTLSKAPLSRDEWRDLWPRRTLFSQNFEGPATEAHDWMGEIVSSNVPAGSSRALAAVDGKPYFARRTRIGIYFDNVRAAQTTWVQFDYFINQTVPIGVFVFNMTQGDNWSYTIRKPVAGTWTTATLDLKHFKKKEGGDMGIKAGDALDDVFVHAGEPATRGLSLIIDNVALIGLDF